MKPLVFIGGSESHVPFVRAAKDLGFTTIVFDRDENCPCSTSADTFYPISTYDTDLVLNKCVELHHSAAIKGVFTYCSATEPLLTTAKIGSTLDLPSFSEKSISKAVDKECMKESFTQAAIPTPEWIITGNYAEALQFVKSSDSTVIMKPCEGGQGSEGVALLQKGSENFEEGFLKTISISQNSNAVLEKFYTGREFSIDGIVIDNNPVILSVSEKFNLGPQNNYVMRGFATGKIAGSDDQFQENYNDLCDISLQAVKALEINNSFFSTDVLLTEYGCKMLECGLFLDCKIDRLLHYAGIDIYKLIIATITGTKNKIHSLDFKSGYALSFLFSNKTGKLKLKPTEIHSKDFLVEWEKIDGDEVRPPKSIADTIGWVLTKGPNSLEAHSTGNNIVNLKLFHVI